MSVAERHMRVLPGTSETAGRALLFAMHSKTGLMPIIKPVLVLLPGRRRKRKRRCKWRELMRRKRRQIMKKQKQNDAN